MEFDKKAREKLKAEAADWLARLDSGDSDLSAFETWRNADPRHASIFAQVAATWKQTGELRTAPQDLPAPAERPAPLLSRRRLVIGSAAAGFGAIAIGGALFSLRDTRTFVETDIGERRTLQLPDRISVELNTNTRIAWAYARRQREIWVEKGEAAFAIVDDALRPFVLHTVRMNAVLGGGRFNLRLRPQGAELIAVSGRARIETADGARHELEPRHALIASGGGVEDLALSADRIDAALAWRRGEIHFQGMALGDALAEFNRYLQQKITFEDQALASIRLGGRFMVDDPAAFLRALEDGFGVQNRKESGRIVLFSGPDRASFSQ